MGSVYASIFGGSFLVLAGGLLATYGWNAYSETQRREALVNLVAAELLINLNIISDQKFIETSGEELEAFVVFPRIQTTGIDSALASGLFLRSTDRLFFTRLAELSEIAKDFNNRLDVTERHLIRLGPNERGKLRGRLRDGRMYTTMKRKLDLLKNLIIESQAIELEREFFVTLPENAD